MHQPGPTPGDLTLHLNEPGSPINQSFLPMFVSEYRRHLSPLIHTFIGLSGPTTTQLAGRSITFHVPPMLIAFDPISLC